MRLKITNGKQYLIFSHIQEMTYLENAYKKVFNSRNWSARDFAKFLIDSVYNSYQNSNNIFSLKTFSNKSQYIDKIIYNYDIKIKKERDDNELEGLVYFPFHPISSGQNDLLSLFERAGDDFILICYNFGIPNFNRFQEYKYNIKIKDSKEITKQKISEFFYRYSHKKDLRLKLLEGFAKSSILWEPYTSRKQRESFGEDELVFNWRRELKKVWDFYEINKNPWWRDKYQMYREKRLPCIKDFFGK